MSRNDCDHCVRARQARRSRGSGRRANLTGAVRRPAAAWCLPDPGVRSGEGTDEVWASNPADHQPERSQARRFRRRQRSRTAAGTADRRATAQLALSSPGLSGSMVQATLRDPIARDDLDQTAYGQGTAGHCDG